MKVDRKIVVLCDKCMKIFELDNVMAKTIDNGVIRHYFQCPNCLSTYTAFYDDNESLQIRKKLRTNISLKEREKLTKRLEQKSAWLKIKYGENND